VDLDKKQWNNRVLYIITRLRPRASFRVYPLEGPCCYAYMVITAAAPTWEIFQHNSSLFLAILKSGLSVKPHMHALYCNTVYE
jgi:hypothetical protein